jgi:hypothetical protein
MEIQPHVMERSALSPPYISFYSVCAFNIPTSHMHFSFSHIKTSLPDLDLPNVREWLKWLNKKVSFSWHWHWHWHWHPCTESINCGARKSHFQALSRKRKSGFRSS